MPYFSGTLQISRGRVVLHDANDYVSMTFYLGSGSNPFYVLTDSVEFPESVDVVFPGR